MIDVSNAFCVFVNDCLNDTDCRHCGYGKMLNKAYQQGRVEGYSQAEKDYFAQSQKDREDTYNCGYAIGRADAIEPLNAIIEESEKMMWCADKTLEKIIEQLKENK